MFTEQAYCSNGYYPLRSLSPSYILDVRRKRMSTSEDIKIRKAIHTDLPSIVRMLADDELGLTREALYDPLPDLYENAFVEISESDDNLLLVAISEEKVVGILQVTCISPFLEAEGLWLKELE